MNAFPMQLPEHDHSQTEVPLTIIQGVAKDGPPSLFSKGKQPDTALMYSIMTFLLINIPTADVAGQDGFVFLIYTALVTTITYILS